MKTPWSCTSKGHNMLPIFQPKENCSRPFFSSDFSLAVVNWINCKGKRTIQLQIDEFWWALEREIRKGISPPQNPSPGWISFKKSKSGFRGFPYLSIGKSEKGFVKLFSWTAMFFLLIMRARSILLFVRTVFQILFPNRTATMKIQKQISQHDLSVEVRFRISRSIANPKSGF